MMKKGTSKSGIMSRFIFCSGEEHKIKAGSSIGTYTRGILTYKYAPPPSVGPKKGLFSYEWM